MDFVLLTCLQSKLMWLFSHASLVIMSDYLAEALLLFPRNLHSSEDGYQGRQAEMLSVLHMNFISDHALVVIQAVLSMRRVLPFCKNDPAVASLTSWLHWRSAERHVRITWNRRRKATRTMEILMGVG
mmetsp:Transcript_25704/g.46456  ORF Transcript_25704/g.46456 Transcript_25704/m.46456 type:complete len:128 (+) Transcript_25704:2-385(+)